MSVVFTRVVTPKPGHLGDTLKFTKERVAAIEKALGIDISINARFGGPAGQLNLVSYHDSMADLEDLRRKVMEGVTSGSIPQGKPDTIESIEDVIWMKL
jgi:hypothetical protein